MTQQLTRPNRQSSQIVRKRFFNGRSREVVLYASISKRFGPILYLSASYTWSQVIIFPSLLLFRSVSVSFPRKLHVLNLLILLSRVLLTPLTSLYEFWCPDNYKTVVDCKIWRCFSWEKYWNVYCGEEYNIQLFYINPDNSLLCGIMVLTSLSVYWFTFGFENISLTWRHHHCRWKTGNFRSKIGTISQARQDLSVKRDLHFCGLIPLNDKQGVAKSYSCPDLHEITSNLNKLKLKNHSHTLP